MDAVLVVDDDPNVIAAHRRTLRQFDVTYARGAVEALDRIREMPFAVCVSDMRMPGMSGNTLLTRIRDESPDTVRIMLTGDADIRTAIGAVNDGNIFRFLAKPCPTPLLVNAIRAGLAQHRLVVGERELLEKTLSGTVRVLTDVLGAVNPAAFNQTLRIHEHVQQVTARLGLPNPWQYEVAAMLSQLGCISLGSETLEAVYSGREVSDVDCQRFALHASIAHDLLSNIPRLEVVARMIARQHESIDLRNVMQPLSERDPAEVGGAILHTAIELERVIARGASRTEAVTELRTRTQEFDPLIVTALTSARDSLRAPASVRTTIPELKVGMTFASDVRTQSGLVIVRAGHEASSGVIARLVNFHRIGAIPAAVNVLADETVPQVAAAS
jgi:ActR/RegA family two-component response regulator